MYIIYPPPKKNWGHHALMLLMLAAIFPLMSLASRGAKPDDFSISAAAGLGDYPLMQEIQNAGGPLAMVKELYQGNLRWHDLNPLYPLILQTVAQNNPVDFARNVHDLNFLIACLATALFFWTLRRAEGEAFGFLAVVALLALPLFAGTGIISGQQWLAMICAYMGWFNLAEESDEEASGFTAGFWIGAALLASPGGGPLFFAFLAYFLYKYKARVFAQKKFWIFLLEFAAMASPLLARDLRLVHNPFYSLTQFVSMQGLPSPVFLGLKTLWVLGGLAMLGLLFDPVRERVMLSGFYLAILFFFVRSPQTSAILAFYSGAAAHTAGSKIFGKGFLWIVLAAAALFCAWAWLNYAGSPLLGQFVGQLLHRSN